MKSSNQLQKSQTHNATMTSKDISSVQCQLKYEVQKVLKNNLQQPNKKLRDH
jgi:hypothetical protein